MNEPPLLDRPVWHALTSHHAALALGTSPALRYAPEYSPFGATQDATLASRLGLAALIPPGGELWLIEDAEIAAPPGTVVVRQSPCVQMIAPALDQAAAGFPIVAALTEDDAADMRALATLTRPGPFLARTHQLGEFIGIKREGKLVAMAGERMKLDGFTEVSGVCTHPDHRGLGYAGGLIRTVAQRIQARGEIPFLHAYASNVGAIALYRSLGFTLRRVVVMAVLARANG